MKKLAGIPVEPDYCGPVERFSRLTIVTHWMSALSFVLVLAAIWGREWIEEYALRVNLLGMHRQLGLVMLVLFVVRIVARKIYPKKPSGKPLSALQKMAVMLCHSALYTFLVAIPTLGWMLTNSHGTVVRFLGVIDLPSLVARNGDLEDTLVFFHEYCAYLMVGMVLVHMCAALWHHFVRKDHVLAAMVPFIGKTAPAPQTPSAPDRTVSDMPTFATETGNAPL